MKLLSLNLQRNQNKKGLRYFFYMLCIIPLFSTLYKIERKDRNKYTYISIIYQN